MAGDLIGITVDCSTVVVPTLFIATRFMTGTRISMEAIAVARRSRAAIGRSVDTLEAEASVVLQDVPAKDARLLRRLAAEERLEALPEAAASSADFPPAAAPVSAAVAPPMAAEVGTGAAEDAANPGDYRFCPNESQPVNIRGGQYASR
jgi:hypothetical protein